MPLFLDCDDTVFPLEHSQVEQLWKSTIDFTDTHDDVVTVKCVSEAEIRHLNLEYRKKDKPTNVLTFSYEQGDDKEHDIALCMSVAKREASEQQIAIGDYTALLLVHAFLHAVGMDHERSDAEAAKTNSAEQSILSRNGFANITLSA